MSSSIERKRVDSSVIEELSGSAKRQCLTPCERGTREPCERGTSCKRAPLEHPVLRLREEQSNKSAELLFRFAKTPKSEVRRVDTLAELQALFSAETARAEKTEQNWLRQPHAKWISDMITELGPAQRRRLEAKHRYLQADNIPVEDFLGRWADVSEFASVVINLWFEDKTLSDVLSRAEELGHLGNELFSGCILEGDIVDVLTTERDINIQGLRPMVELMHGEGGKAPVYKVAADNCFQQEQNTFLPPHTIDVCEGMGSLNTTWTYLKNSDASRVDIMDDFHEQIDKALFASADVKLNLRMYLIWKFQHYVTSHHQDTHVPPHFTLYNQVSGVSLFHFLPLLVGLYVSYVGRRSAADLESILARLDNLGIGSHATLGPGQLALITPFGAHGVWVPSCKLNPQLSPFTVSLIRAAELFVRPIFDECRARLSRENWNVFLAPSSSELALLDAFSSRQAQLCAELGLSRHDWLWFVRKTWQRWRIQDDMELNADSGDDGSDSASQKDQEEACDKMAGAGVADAQEKTRVEESCTFVAKDDSGS
eukprot:TRINITY_DN21278_c0_g2_i1.p1 TRINITY_DN21278_c0_g2~~TRINITY_DN21278_c0_g2_i1.p1  ORF type:complete len:541 (+),score=91.51 TRINITY_DN21278_c0_g2_i1:68-1690(+)